MAKNLKYLFYAGLFLLSFCLLACQFLLTRILSLVFYYHFVFLIISLVMFGLTLGSLIVYCNKSRYDSGKIFDAVARFSFFSGCGLLISFTSLFYLPGLLISCGVAPQTVIYFYVPILLVSFITFGIALSLILTRSPEIIGEVYAVNLLGSAAGCIGAYFILDNFNAFSSACVLTGLCFLGAMSFSIVSGNKNKKRIVFYAVSLIFVLLSGRYNQSANIVQPLWAKDKFYFGHPLYSKWNFFSCITVRLPTHRPFGWGYSTKVSRVPVKTKELMIAIDEGAGTVLTKFNNFSDLDYLKYDISNLPYRIRSFNSVLVMGSGGGRDLLSAELFKAKKIVGVELNKNIMDIVLEKTVHFDGHIKRIPEIKIYNDDGRAFIARSRQKYDLIQSSLVDSSAASALGSFALSENSLYTKEAWIIYLRHLTDKGVLTFSRWYLNDPLEIYRLLSLAQSALDQIGIQGDIRSHLVLVRTQTPYFEGLDGIVARSSLSGFSSIKGTIADPDNKNGIWEDVSPTEVRLKEFRRYKRDDLNSVSGKDIDQIIALVQSPMNVGTILVSKTPFTARELDVLDKAADELGFEVVLDGRKSLNKNFDRILNGNYHLNDSEADVSPSTDDRPFYFYFSNFMNFFSPSPIGQGTVILRQTSALIIVLGFLFIFFPFIITPQRCGFGKIELWPSVYFMSIGLGFMFLEIPLIQRLGLFLGHPVYGLTVVLFSLLLACGAGSYFASKLKIGDVLRFSFPFLFLLILTLAFGLPVILWDATEQIIPVKILISGISVLMIGLFMGMFFPTGVTAVSRNQQAPLIFYWAINGFSSMCAAAFATIFMINFGFCITILFSFLFYFAAFYALKMQK